MKRAEVCRVSDGWRVDLFAAPTREPDVRLYLRTSGRGGRTFPTHADALAHALAEVGLTENTEKEKDR